MAQTKEDQDCINQFVEYLRIPTVHPNIDYEPAVNALKKLCSKINGIKFSTFSLVPNNPFLLATLPGKYPEKKSLLLLNHMDVVPANKETWTVDPFEGKIIDGEIFGRGAQDMKCVAIQQINALKRLIQSGFVPNRTVHMMFTPDEELDRHGVRLLANSDYFRKLNVGFVMDEGIASPSDEILLFYGERSCHSVRISCRGNAGHGSQFIKNAAADKFLRIFSEIQSYRKEQERILEENSDLTLGEVNTVNINVISGGSQINVVPSELEMLVDCRLSPFQDIEEFNSLVDSWVTQIGGPGCTWAKYYDNVPNKPNVSKIEGTWWETLLDCLSQLEIPIKKTILSAGTDCSYLRAVGYNCVGFSPLHNTPVLLHDDDERLSIEVFLQGIRVYEKIFENLLSIN